MRTINQLKQRINESEDYINKEVEEELRKLRKCRYVGACKKPIVLELRGDKICLKM